MSLFRRAGLAPAIAIVLLVGTAGEATAADNAVVVVNEIDGTYEWKGKLNITRANGDTVDDGNGAASYTSCVGCDAAAAAIQVVLVTGDGGTGTPTNIAIAQTYGCQSCVAFADARQFIVYTHRPVHFTDAGNAEIDAIRSDLASVLASAELDSLEDAQALEARIDPLEARLRTVLRDHLVLVGGGRIAARRSLQVA